MSSTPVGRAMSTRTVYCESCDASIRTRPSDETRWIECPRCGEEVEIRPMRRRKQAQSRKASSRPRKNQKTNPLLWVGLGAGGVLVVGLIIAVVVLAGGNETEVASDSGASETPGSNPVADSPTSDASGTPGVTPASNPGPIVRTDGGATAKDATVRFAWQKGREYPYEFSLEASLPDRLESTSGICVYRMNESSIQELLPQLSGPTGTGTAFAVSPDGYLLTCAHVVEGAGKIEITLGNETFPAEVVASNSQRDLAILKIPAKNLPIVPMADSSTVQLAQEVRAIGFPLSDVLGSNVKVTRGSIAGLNDMAEGRMLQVDASINPGNSGGALVDDQGHVVGVVSAKLTGDAVTAVGFAVPSNDARQMLQSKGISIPIAAPGTKLEGPELARRVVPAIGMVKVTLGPVGKLVALNYIVKFQTRQTPKPGSSVTTLPSITPVLEKGILIMDEYGSMLDYSGSQKFPYLMGSVGAVVVESLSPQGEKKWQQQSDFPLMLVDQPGNVRPFAGLRPGSRRSPFSRRPGQPISVVRTFPARYTATYEERLVTSKLVRINKKFETVTLENSDSPYIQMVGSGDIDFDRQAGVLRKMDFAATLTQNSNGRTASLPLKITTRLLNAAEWESVKRKNVEQKIADQEASQDRINKSKVKELERLPKPAVARLVKRFFKTQQTASATRLNVLRGGKRILVANYGKTPDKIGVDIFDQTSDRRVGQFPHHQDLILLLETSDNGSVVASGSNKRVLVWNLQTLEKIAQIDMPFIRTAAASKDGGLVYLAGASAGVGVLDTQTKRIVKSWKPKTGCASLSLSPDGSTLSGIHSKGVTTWDTNGKELSNIKYDTSTDVGVISSNGRFGLTPAEKSSLALRDLLSGKIVKDFEAEVTGRRYSIDAEGNRCVFVTGDDEMVIWDRKSSRVVDQFKPHRTTQHLAISPDGLFVATMGYEGILQLWELPER